MFCAIILFMEKFIKNLGEIGAAVVRIGAFFTIVLIFMMGLGRLLGY